ncbi:two-component system chemotaxis response regulator CheB [Paenibacillus cellulosilyticus]|uniref:Protein-glutamate methylesterase/protein-glutamine glutaminase n=1 Tax=Paenibacillus cellulosilyticus TaxID=375489 RepID=A0A2V2Z041_9BACL|nr:chemotaxis response regulator protein-glutamate methylesterase [Paenibacillus cellulosilyticus]PWW06415.1 two-component system chemotaxis response regulator CheB [Paenibacillus cellulosilyticus]QKS46239.1 chemotaxis response regulator protein-glutamate methylesterase [Paenibacillus cellulosilyticus]
MSLYRVLVVDDSAFMRKIVSDLITRDDQFEVVATAGNGLTAIDMVAKHKPDAVTMDLEMPEMNGLEALQIIMNERPVPVIMLSGISEENTRDTIKALHNGAFDFIRKPAIDGSVDINQVGEQLLDKLRIAVLVSRAQSKTKPEKQIAVPKLADRKRSEGTPDKQPEPTAAAGESKRQSKQTKKQPTTPKSTSIEKTASQKPVAADSMKSTTVPSVQSSSVEYVEAVKLTAPSDRNPLLPTKGDKRKGTPVFDSIVLIGTSTGGPRALHEVICTLPADINAPVLVVQHMPPNFTRSLAQRLDAFSAVKVTEAVQGERVVSGTVYIAPGGFHMELAKDRSGYYIKLTEDELRSGHRPSVDVLFESAASCNELRRHAVLMTGMGSDGAKGMKLLRDSGALTTIAEAEETCVVYGMPRAAVEMGAATDIVPLPRISSALVQAVARRSTE